MSNLDHAIATQRANLKRRRQWLRAHNRALRREATRYCGKDSTLVGAFLTGMVLGTGSPPRANAGPRRSAITAGNSLLRSQAVASLQMLVVNSLLDFMTRPRRTTGQVSSGSAYE